MNKINYMMTKSYRKEWGIIDAVREIVQNCLDNKRNPSNYNIDIDGLITITTPSYELPLSALALGESEKPDDAIGGFGEGLKLALMILAREQHGEAYMLNGTNIITPVFEWCETMQADLFALIIEPNKDSEGELIDNKGLSYVFNFPMDKLDELKQKINLFSDNVLPLPSKVDILEEYPGQIFVNGLFVCKEPKFKYGYNFAPKHLKLGCDRQIASTLGMAWVTSEIWAEKLHPNNADEILGLMTEDSMDVADIHYHLNTTKAKLITSAFVARFGNVKIKPMGSGLGYGMSVGGSLYGSMRKSGYTAVSNPYEESGAPYRVLFEFMEKQGKKVRRDFKVKFKDILTQAKEWTT